MRRPSCCALAVVMIFLFAGQACTTELTPEQKQLVADLRQDLDRIRKEVEQAKADDARYSGGLIKALIGTRLEILKTNEALVEQRIHAIESGARVSIVVNAAKPDSARAAELAKDIESQRTKVAEARAEADRDSGGLAQAMAETSVATARSTLAMLEQQYFTAKYGLALPSLPSPAAGAPPTADKGASVTRPARQGLQPQEKPGAAECLKIETFDSSVLSTNNLFTELAWKVDVTNSCAEPFGARVTFTILDKDDFELDSASEDVYVPTSGTAKARGKMLVNPPEKARRMAKQGARVSAR
ncbi:MAG: hypothetical protein ACRD1B_02880 [Thermoanaerobaculia bacterium]